MVFGVTQELPFTENDSATGRSLNYHSITCAPKYRNHSFEELRAHYYQYGDTIAPSKTLLQPQPQPLFLPPPPVVPNNPVAPSGLFESGKAPPLAFPPMGFDTSFSWRNLHHVRGLADMTITYPFS
ncbi:hypothetical protein FRB96_003215 [Tulasnella sp. 330]|nr:hypothetical protein FRB96_003215 [Tulasnella sp. 330]